MKTKHEHHYNKGHGNVDVCLCGRFKFNEKAGPAIVEQRKDDRKERLLPNGVPRWVRCYDNDGETIDRYTVVFTGRYTHKTEGEHWLLAMNGSPFHPQGFGQHMTYPYQVDAQEGKWPPALGRKNHLGKRIAFEELPADCKKLVIHDYKYLWDIK
jgi:hypothetical protein